MTEDQERKWFWKSMRVKRQRDSEAGEGMGKRIVGIQNGLG